MLWSIIGILVGTPQVGVLKELTISDYRLTHTVLVEVRVSVQSSMVRALVLLSLIMSTPSLFVLEESQQKRNLP